MEALSPADLQQLREKGISREKLEQQLNDFEKGFPFARLVSPALKGQGVLSFPAEEEDRYRQLYRHSLSKNKVLKFVPASGAATRMFKNLYALYESLKTEENREAGEALPLKPDVQEFFDRLPELALYS